MLFPEEGGIHARSPNQLVFERAMLLTPYDVITVIHVIFLCLGKFLLQDLTQE